MLRDKVYFYHVFTFLRFYIDVGVGVDVEEVVCMC